MPFTRTYNWGESLRLEAAMADGGLAAATKRIAENMGSLHGSRNTFATLFTRADPPESRKDQERAYLLLVALGLNPEDWGMGDFTPPKAWSDSVLDLRTDATGWLRQTLELAH